MSDDQTAPTDEPSVFTRIIRGELPGRIVWRDEDVVSFLTIAPIRPGHLLVVPVRQVDRWTDLDEDAWVALSRAQLWLGRALQAAMEPVRVGAIIAGLEVPHCHVHLVPITTEADLDFRLADSTPDPGEMDDAAAAVREELRRLGRAEVADA